MISLACGEEEDVSTNNQNSKSNPESQAPVSAIVVNPSESPSSTQERLKPFENIPFVPQIHRETAQAIYSYFVTQRLAGNRSQLVKNDNYELDVFRGDLPETGATTGLVAKIINPVSADRAIVIRDKICAELVEAAGMMGSEIRIQFGVAVPNAGYNPMEEIGFTAEEADIFLKDTTCGEVA